LWVKVKRVCNNSHSRLRIRRRGLQASGEQACIHCPMSSIRCPISNVQYPMSNLCLHHDLRRGQLQRRPCCHARCPLLAAPPSDAAVSAEGVPIPAANTHGLICVRKAAASCDAMITVTSSAANSSSPRDMVSDVVRPRPCPCLSSGSGPTAPARSCSTARILHQEQHVTLALACHAMPRHASAASAAAATPTVAIIADPSYASIRACIPGDALQPLLTSSTITSCVCPTARLVCVPLLRWA
jgi:hypothetical protein